MLGLVILLAAIVFSWDWMWGVLFLLWVILDIQSGVSYFMEPIERKSNPILYWFLIGTWSILSLYVLLEPIFYPYS